MSDINPDIRKAMHAVCLEAVEGRIQSISESVQQVQAAANQESKSSMGDKYETSRAMMHREKAHLEQQLGEQMRLKQTLKEITLDKTREKVSAGSIVRTKQGLFFVSVPLGKMTAEGQDFFAISLASPIGKAMKGKSSGEMFQLNGNNMKVLEVV